MINISETASVKVRTLLEQQGKQDHALRIFVRGMSCSGPSYGMALDDAPTAEDAVEERDGIRIVVDPVSAPYLDGAEVDYVEGLMGQGFTVKNPNAEKPSGGGGCHGGGGGGGGCACSH